MSRTGSVPEAGQPGGPTAPAGRVLLVSDHTPAWQDMIRMLEAGGVECVRALAGAGAADIVADLQPCRGVLVIDLEPDPVRSMTILTAVRRDAPLVPVVVVAHDPSIELARRIRLSGVFYMALDPVSPEEMQSVLTSAFGCLGRARADTSMCRAKRRVLIIDDDADFVASTSSLLESQGYSVSSARSAREGLDKVLEESPDLLVLDVMMEHDSAGYQVNQALKFGAGFECHRHVPVLMVSSISVDPAARFSMAGEVDMITPNAYLTKPVDVPRFLAEIRALLGEQTDVVTG
jgi:two-component system alkaline phosphatase synthesis response regulator PhoP